LRQPAALPACLAALEARACEDSNDRIIPECEAALSGTVELGDGGSVDEECKGAALCDHSAGCPGACVTLRRPGEACSDDDMCANGLACSSQTGLCARPAVVGEACQGGVETECQAGLFCVGDDEQSSTAGECVAIRTAPASVARDWVSPLASLPCATADLAPGRLALRRVANVTGPAATQKALIKRARCS
jgi:hypothetical protein